MEKIALIFGSQTIYWSAIILALAAMTAILGFLALYLGKSGNASAAFTAIPLGFILSLVLSRLVDWYCYAETYSSIFSALTRYSIGGFALVGVFAGCLLTALLTRVFRLHCNTPEMLDCMCLAGGAGIVVGRLASFFNSTDRGQIIESVQSMPWVYPVTNSVSGVTEYRLATFLLQAMLTGIIVAVLLVFFLRNAKKGKDGDTTLLFLLCYGASQVILDSTRYDSIYFRFNGFVSIVQVMSALALALAIIVFSVRMVKNNGFKVWYLAVWTAMLALIGGAGYMEYHVQRHGNEALFAYSVMSVCLILLVALTIFTRQKGLKEHQESIQ